MALPEVGEVFAFEVAPGVEVALRVVAEHDEARCVVMTRHQGPPLEKLPRRGAVFEVQARRSHGWDRPVLGGWVRTPAPAEVRRVGRSALRSGELGRVVHPQVWLQTKQHGERVLPMASWEEVLRQVAAQWQWDHARATVVQETSPMQALFAAAMKRPRTPSTFFDAWRGSIPEGVIHAAEQEVEAVQRAMHGASPAGVRRLLAKLGQRLSALHPFGALEQDDIDEALQSLSSGARGGRRR